MAPHRFAFARFCCLAWAAWVVLPGPPLAAEPPFAGLRLPERTSLVAAALAQGVQVYEGRAAPTGGYRWELKGPQAALTTVGGERFGRHDPGPTWTADDGSQVTGALAEKVDAPGVNAIPWLLLTVKSKSGSGVLSGVDYVLRVETRGGGAPAEAPLREGETKAVAYQALYLFLQQTAAR